MYRIKRVQIINLHNNGSAIEVGKATNGKQVASIDMSADDSGVYYMAKDAQGRLIKVFDNCPVEIDYF